jgi:hypothetical protein
MTLKHAPQVEVRRVYLAAEDVYVWAVIHGLRLVHWAGQDPEWVTEFKILKVFHDAATMETEANNWMEGYIQGLAARR